jgi:hypothetical protein
MPTPEQPVSGLPRVHSYESQSSSGASHTSGSDTITPVLLTSTDDSETPSIWSLPGLDKDTFYAAALYLHVDSKGQLRDPSEYLIRREPKTDEKKRKCLDCLTDCFARSKSQDPSAHVTATAIVIDRMMIKVYISKNHSQKGLRLSGDRSQLAVNENRNFADKLFKWFNYLASQTSETLTDHNRGDSSSSNTAIPEEIYKFNQSRLEHYIKKIVDMDLKGMDDRLQGTVRTARDKYKEYQQHRDLNTHTALIEYTRLAAECRSNVLFQNSYQNAGLRSGHDIIHKSTTNLVQFAKWINYLGRLGAAYATFYEFVRLRITIATPTSTRYYNLQKKKRGFRAITVGITGGNCMQLGVGSIRCSWMVS